MLHLSGCDEQILHDLPEREANRILSRLRGGNLDAKKVVQSDGRWAIAISSDLAASALTFLDARRVLSPRDTTDSISSKSGLVPSREEQWFRYERSVSTSIEDSLSTVLGVLEARVHLNLPETDPLLGVRNEGIGSGSVLLVVDATYASSDQEIAALVAGASGVPQAKVTVMRSLAQAESHEEVESFAVRQPGGGASESQQDPALSQSVHEASRRVNPALILAMTACLGTWGAVLAAKRNRRVKFVLPHPLQE